MLLAGYVTSESDAGSYASLTKCTEDGSKVVTWCPEPKEKTLRYWSMENHQMSLLGSFTPDKEVIREFQIQ